MSVVLTVFNRGWLVGETIASILRQTYRHFELIVCDDASTDDTQAVCEAAAGSDHRVRYVRNARNLGMPGNLNLGISMAQGSLIANLHDGDVYGGTLLQRWVEGLDRCPHAAFVFNAYAGLDSRGRVAMVWRESLPPCTDGRELLRLFYRRWRFDSPVWGTVMARRWAYELHGPFDPRFGAVSDVDMWLRLAEHHPVAYVPEPLIGLPSREALPSNYAAGTEHLVRRLFRESRMRVAQGHPLRAVAEMSRHQAFVALSAVYGKVLKARRHVLRSRGSAVRVASGRQPDDLGSIGGG